MSIDVTRNVKNISISHPTREIVVKRRSLTVSLHDGGRRGLPGPEGPQGEQGEQGPAGPGAAIGDFLTGGTPNRLLHIDDDGNLADNLFFAKREVLSGGGFEITLDGIQPADWDRNTEPIAGFIDLSDVGLSKMFVINTNGANGGDGGALFITNGASNSLIVTDIGMQVGVPLQYVVGDFAEGKVLTSDSAGNASWQDPTGGTESATYTINRAVDSDDAPLTYQTAGFNKFSVGLLSSDPDFVIRSYDAAASSIRVVWDTGVVRMLSGASIENGADIDGLSVTGSFDANALRLEDVGEPSVASDAATKNYVDTTISSELTGYATESYVNTGLATKQNTLGFTPEDVANKTNSLSASTTQYPTVGLLNTQLALKLSLTGGSMTGPIVMKRATTSDSNLIRFETNNLGRWYYGFYSGDGTDDFELHRGGGGGEPFRARYADGYIEYEFGVELTYATANRLAIIDGSKNLIAADTSTYPSLTELSYIKGVTSSIQTQINAISGGSGITRSIVVTSGNFTAGSAASTDYVYSIAGNHTPTMPTAVGNTNRYTFKNNHSANITFLTTSSQTIDGGTLVLGPAESVDLIPANGNWIIV